MPKRGEGGGGHFAPTPKDCVNSCLYAPNTAYKYALKKSGREMGRVTRMEVGKYFAIRPQMKKMAKFCIHLG
jgi:hypothetical protein